MARLFFDLARAAQALHAKQLFTEFRHLGERISHHHPAVDQGRSLREIVMSAKKAPSLDAINYKIDEIIQVAKNVESNARDWAERFQGSSRSASRSEEAKKEAA